MRIVVSIEREYEMDEARVLTEPGFDPPSPLTPLYDKRGWLKESFFELCGIERDEDHVDGTYVRLVLESVDVDFRWGVLEEPPA